MKKINKLICAAAFVIAGISLAGCADAVANDGSNMISYGSVGGSKGGVAPFSMYNDKFDYQIWKDYNADCTTSVKDGELIISQTGVWYGVALCSNAKYNDESSTATIFDLTKVKYVSFEARANIESVLTLNLCTEDGGGQDFDLTDEYQTFVYQVKDGAGSSTGKHYCLVSLVQDKIKEPNKIVHYIKNIAFYDEDCNEIVPEVSN